MDCEKFDRITLDLLYAELDELTAAAAERHMDHCSRCSTIGSRLRATQKVGTLPLITPPASLEAKILDAERRLHTELPWGQRLERGVSVLASYAMRPQLAMAALLLLMLGSSLLFLRVRPGERDRVSVTERGVPEREAESVAIVPLAERAGQEALGAAHGVQEAEAEHKAEKSAPAPDSLDKSAAKSQTKEAKMGSAEPSDPYGSYVAAMGEYRQGHYVEAQKRFDEVAAAGGEQASSAMLYAARAARSSSGCAAAAPRFDAVHERYSGTGIGNEAAWQAAVCYRALGQFERAKKNYEALLDTQAYGQRAQSALAQLENPRGETDAKGSSAPSPLRAKPVPPKKKPAATSKPNAAYGI